MVEFFFLLLYPSRLDYTLRKKFELFAAQANMLARTAKDRLMCPG